MKIVYILLLIGLSCLSLADEQPSGPSWAWAVVPQLSPGWTTSYVSASDVAIDAGGDLWVTGRFVGELAFPNATLVAQEDRAYLAKVDRQGHFLWGTLVGEGDDCVINVLVETDHLGNAYLVGWIYSRLADPGGEVRIGETTFALDSRPSFFVAKLGPDGEWLWVRGGVETDAKPTVRTYHLAVDANGDVYVGGNFHHANLTLGDSTLVKDSGGHQVWFAKMSSEGEWLWAKYTSGHEPSSRQQSQLRGLVTDSQNDLYVSFVGYGSGYIGGTNVSSSANYSNHIIKFNTDGEILWLRQPENHDPVGWNSSIGYLAVDLEDNLIGGGWFDGETSYGTITQTNLYSFQDQLVIWKMNPEGEWVWVRQIREPTAVSNWWERSNCVAVHADGENDIYVTAQTSSEVYFNSVHLPVPDFEDCGYLAKMDAEGNWLWATHPRSKNSDYFMASKAFAGGVVTDPFGHLFLWGEFSGGLEWDGINIERSSMDWTTMLAKLGSESCTDEDCKEPECDRHDCDEHKCSDDEHWEYSDELCKKEIDTDADGLSDAWEEYFFGDLRFSADEDADGDGLSNADEILAGTSPEDASDAQKVSGTATNGLSLTWMTIPGRQYQVEIQQLSLPPEAPWEVLSAYENQTTNRHERTVILPDRGHPLRARVNLLLGSE